MSTGRHQGGKRRQNGTAEQGNPDKNLARATIIAAVIASLGAVIAAVIAVAVPKIWPSGPSPDPQANAGQHAPPSATRPDESPSTSTPDRAPSTATPSSTGPTTPSTGEPTVPPPLTPPYRVGLKPQYGIPSIRNANALPLQGAKSQDLYYMSAYQYIVSLDGGHLIPLPNSSTPSYTACVQAQNKTAPWIGLNPLQSSTFCFKDKAGSIIAGVKITPPAQSGLPVYLEITVWPSPQQNAAS